MILCLCGCGGEAKEGKKFIFGHQNRGKYNGFYNKKHTDKSKNKQSISHYGKIPWNKGKKGVCVAWNRGVPQSEDLKRKNSESHKGKIPWNKGKIECYSEETLKKMSDAKKGIFTKENHPSWKGGITSLNQQIRHSEKMLVWRKEVFEKDFFTCQNCNQIGENLNAHHIIPFHKIIEENNIKTIKEANMCKELWNINNGTTLCESCHDEINKRR